MLINIKKWALRPGVFSGAVINTMAPTLHSLWSWPSPRISFLTDRLPGYHKFSRWSLFRGFINMQQEKMELHNFQLPQLQEGESLSSWLSRVPGSLQPSQGKWGGLTHPLSAKPPREMAASMPPSSLSLGRLHTLCAQGSRACFEPCFTSRSNGKNSVPHLFFSFPPLKFDHIPNFSHTAWFPFLNGVKFMSVIRELAWENHLSFKSYMF